LVGGFTAVADRDRLAIERLEDRLSGRVANLSLPADADSVLANGALLRAFSQVAAALPSQRQNKRVKIEGEVLRPAEYLLPANSTVRDAVRAAGGYTDSAFVYATELMRESVRRIQQQNYDRALSDLENDLARANGSLRVGSNDEVNAQSARNSATTRLIDRLRAVRPNGRIVLQLPPDASDLPDELLLEDGDRLYVPPRPNSVGVFGSVFNGAAYLYQSGRTIGDYLRFAGGPKRGADEESIFVVRASGSVVSNRQGAGWFRDGNIQGLAVEPGDTVFVPEEMDRTTLVQGFKDWTQILFQFGLGVAGIKNAIR
jgi:protein involved in polysaccharide export with SLBB domain